MDSQFKLHVKLGNAEFAAEGRESTVREEFGRFLQLLPSIGRQHESSAADGEHGLLEIDAEETTTDRRLQEVFKVDESTGVVSLRVAPNTELQKADTILALLYGFRELRDQDPAPSDKLLDGVRASGVTGIERIDRSLGPYNELVTRGGKPRRGKQYGLTGAGKEKAREIIDLILKQRGK